MTDRENDQIVIKRVNRKRTLSHGETIVALRMESPSTSCSGKKQPKHTDTSKDIWFDNSFCCDKNDIVRNRTMTHREGETTADVLNSSDIFLAGLDIDNIQADNKTPTAGGYNLREGTSHPVIDNTDGTGQRNNPSIENHTKWQTDIEERNKGAGGGISSYVDRTNEPQQSTRDYNDDNLSKYSAGDILDSIFGDNDEKLSKSQKSRNRVTVNGMLSQTCCDEYRGPSQCSDERRGNCERDFSLVSQTTQPVRFLSHINSQRVIRAKLKSGQDNSSFSDGTDLAAGDSPPLEVVQSCDSANQFTEQIVQSNSDVPTGQTKNQLVHHEIDQQLSINTTAEKGDSFNQHGTNYNEDPIIGSDKASISDKSNNHETAAATDEIGTSFMSQIRDRLQQNATVVTPLRDSERQRDEMVAKAASSLADIADIADGSLYDIGPFFGLPEKVRGLFETHRGIKKFYDWQIECLQLPSLLRGENLVYSLPTSGGKTLVAEVLILKQIICRKRDALLILPFVSIVQEKVRNLARFAADLDFLIEEYAGSKGRMPPTRHRKNCVYIATIEKAHSLVNSLIEINRLSAIGLVVVDELHMIGEGGSRGSNLEITLLKIKHASDAQIIGMSATLNNIDDLQKFLNAHIYSNNFRPVELTEKIKLSDTIYVVDKMSEDNLRHSRVVHFEYTKEMETRDPDHLLGLVTEVIPQNSCLIFCATKKNCENVAHHLCKMMSQYKRELGLVKKEERKSLYNELCRDGNGRVCAVLQTTLRYGVAYHHSGLTMDERRLIEDAYSDGVLCVLACTSTLAAGVNLPAKRVILRSPYVGSVFIRRNQYKQMIGRAGRAGIDSSGESILISQPKDKERVRELLHAPLDTCVSSLVYDAAKGIRSLLLSLIGLKLTTNTEQLFSLMSGTLLAIQNPDGRIDVVEHTRQSLQQLVDAEMVKEVTSDAGVTGLEITPLGKATFKGSIDIDDAARLYEDLTKAEESLVLANHLHLLYLVTPYEAARDVTPDWMIYFEQIKKLDAIGLSVMSLIGVPEGYIARRAWGQSSKQKIDSLVVNRFYLTLVLYDLWNNKSIWDVANTFHMARGYIQNVLNNSAGFAVCTQHFCQELDELWPFVPLFDDLVKRLTYCVNSELIPLVEIPGVKIARAKLLYKAGYTSLASIVNAIPDQLSANIRNMPRKAAAQIIASAKVLMNDKMEALFEEVDKLVAVPDAQQPTRNNTVGNRGNTNMSTTPDDRSIPPSQNSTSS